MKTAYGMKKVPKRKSTLLMEVMSLMTFLMDIPGNMTGLVGVWLEREKEKTAFTFPNCKELASI